MELADLKSIWTEVVEADQATYLVEEQQIRQVINQKSQLLLAKIVRELKFKRWLMGGIGILTMVVSSVYLFDTGEGYLLDDVFSRKEMAAFIFFLGLLITILFVNIVSTYRQIKQFQESAADLHSTLAKARQLLRRIQRLAIFADSFAIPPLVAWYTYNKLFGAEPFSWDHRIWYVLLASLLALVIIFLFSRAMQHRKFGKYIDQLNRHLLDLETLNNEKVQ